MVWLLHPTHRKLIKLLRKHVEDNGVIFLTVKDIEDCNNIFTSTNFSYKRHQRVAIIP